MVISKEEQGINKNKILALNCECTARHYIYRCIPSMAPPKSAECAGQCWLSGIGPMQWFENVSYRDSLPSSDAWLLPCQLCDLGQVALPCCIRVSPPLWDHHRTVLVTGRVKWFSPWRTAVQGLQADLSCSFCCCCCCCWSRNGSKTKRSQSREWTEVSWWGQIERGSRKTLKIPG